MDKYTFRGKRTDNGEWAFGYYLYVPRANRTEILNMESEYTYCVVEPQTIGQCTGLKDKNGKLLYEGDKVECHYIEVDKSYKDEIVSGVVKFNDGCFDVELENSDGKWRDYLKVFVANHAVKITGTIHD